jgi:hypothetical protein
MVGATVNFAMFVMSSQYSLLRSLVVLGAIRLFTLKETRYCELFILFGSDGLFVDFGAQFGYR